MDPRQMINALSRYLRDQSGAGAAEFTLVLLPLTAFVFGFIHLCLMTYTVTQLHWATEDAARCASVRIDCKVLSGTSYAADEDLTEAWANTRYKGFAAPTFAYTPSGCGHTVVGTANYAITVPLFSHSFALQSDACFP